jgi:serine/threonine-protein kinase HipA
MLGELDYLLESPDDRAGALSFGLGQEPPPPRRKFNKTLELAKLQEIADAIVRDDIKEKGDDAVQIEELMLIGTSMGGARPKTVVEDDQGLWIAKFNRADDRWNYARVEHAMLALAKKCEISAAESRVVQVGGKDVLLVRRFDRFKTDKGYARARMISGLTLLQADENERDRWSYISLAEEIRRLVANPSKDAPELFRRMCFNALISNIDDHPRNHALIAKDREWNLSPAYDLTPSPVIAQERRDLAMTCGDKGRFACASNILSQHTRFLLGPVDAKTIVENMREQVSATWYDVARAEGVSEKDAEAIRGAFVYEGFDS